MIPGPLGSNSLGMGPGRPPFNTPSPPGPTHPESRHALGQAGLSGAPLRGLWTEHSFIEVLKALPPARAGLLRRFRAQPVWHLCLGSFFHPRKGPIGCLEMPHWSTLPLFLIQIRNVGTGLCVDTKHGAVGSLLRLESCVRGRGEAAWNNMQVRPLPGTRSHVLCTVCGGLQG